MLNNLRHQLWEAKYLNPVSLHDLIENGKDSDYKSINFIPSTSGIEVKLVFEDDGELVEAVYLYDSNDLLQQIFMIEPNGKSLIFDRETTIKSLLTQIHLVKTGQKNNEIPA